MVRGNEDTILRIKGTQEPIISKEDFETVQQMIKSRRRERKDGTVSVFAGLMRCPDCGWTLSFTTNKRRNVSYYHCSKYVERGKESCPSHYIRYDVLCAYVLSRIRYWAEVAQADEEKLLKKLLSASDRENGANRKKQGKELKKAEKRKAEIDSLFTRMYEDFVSERITEYNFQMLSEKYQKEQAELEEKITSLRKKLENEKQNKEDAEKWVSLIKEYAEPTELTAPLVNALIEKILVHHAVKNEDGTKEQEIEIYYRFIGKIE